MPASAGSSNAMSDSIVIEVHERIAGVAVRDSGGVFFFASDQYFAALDGQPFRDALAAEIAARHHARGDLHVDR